MPSQVYAHKRYVKICISFVLNLQFYTQIYPKISKCFLLFYHILRGALSTHSKWDLLYQPTKSETNIILHYQNFVSYLRWKTKWKSKINTDNHVGWVLESGGLIGWELGRDLHYCCLLFELRQLCFPPSIIVNYAEAL